MDARILRSAALAAALAASACGPRLPETSGGAAELLAVLEAERAAQDDFQAGSWDRAAVGFRRMADVAGDAPHLGGWRDAAVYNLACVHARAGRPSEAAATFAESIAQGLRPRLQPDRNGNWVPLAAGISLPHILSDPDLDTIRGEKAYSDALAPYLGGGGDGIGWAMTPIGAEVAAGGLLPAVVSFSSGEVHVTVAGPPPEPGKPAKLVPVPESAEWGRSFGHAARFLFVDARGAVCVNPPAEAKLVAEASGAPPVLPFRRWILEDGDERWAVAHARRILDAVAAAPGADAARVVLVGKGSDAATAVWAAALAMPERVSAVCAVGATFHTEGWADLLAAVPAKRGDRGPWKVIVGPADDAAAAAMKTIGIEVERTEPAEIRSAAVAAAHAK